MKIRNLLSLRMTVALVAFIIFGSTIVQADDTYEEVTYDNLIQQINYKKSRLAIARSATSFDTLMIHAGFGLVTTASTISYGGADNLKYQNGFQISLGIDLFSPNWAAEGVLRNFGQATSGTETRSLREFDLKILYRDATSAAAGYRMGMGLGNRYFKLTDDHNSRYINDTTPTSLFFVGLDIYTSKNVSLGLEAGLRSAMITSTADKSSLDTTLRLDTYF